MQDIPSTVKYIIIWLLVGTGVTLGFMAFQRHEARANVVNTVGERGITITRARDGHYYLPGRIGTETVMFMVDTGATRTAIPENIAKDANLNRGESAKFNTANGIADGYFSQTTVVLEGLATAENWRVAVMPGFNDNPLLGMDLLKRFELKQSGNTLRISPAKIVSEREQSNVN